MAIKIFRGTDAGAPTLNGMVGSLITVLDAVLVNGYNTVSVTGITRTSATATVTTAVAHGLATGDSATISGAEQSDYNIDAVVTVIDSIHFSYTVANEPATPATGTIACKRSPAGFTKTFSGANKATYRANDLSSVRHTLRVLDDGLSAGGGGEARVFAFESMGDVDAGSGPYPTAAQSSNGYFWRKSSTNDSTARAWMIITDGRIVYYFSDYAAPASGGLTSNTAQFSGAFGDILSYKPGDAYASILTGCTSANSTSSPPCGLFAGYSSITNASSFTGPSIVIARDFTAVAGARYVGLFGSGISAPGLGSSTILSYPHLIDNGFYMTPVMVTQGSPSLIRGRLPGCYEALHGRCFNNGDIITNVQGMPGKTFMMVYGTSGPYSGALMIDITGPWDA
ncbi:hypothetical protein [Aquabacterium sp.]|uniref:hypothetical protein n=1 Tax=Aquabacterium sp. TaxID=1872578 RepID=UPI0026245411|nr:hypothetical protein [Aquabacterium sp.]MDD2978126.1 hypothetical protein [Aquabacterium sp.]